MPSEQDTTVEATGPSLGDDTSVYFDDVDDELVQPPRRARSRTTVALLVLLAAAATFAAGVRMGKSRAGATGGERAIAASAEGGAGSGRVVGQVKLVDGTTLYVTDVQGNTVKVTTDPSSIVTRTTPAAVADLRPGDTVVAEGAAGADGTVAATRVAEGGAGPSFGGFGEGGEGGGAHGGGRGE